MLVSVALQVAGPRLLRSIEMLVLPGPIVRSATRLPSQRISSLARGRFSFGPVTVAVAVTRRPGAEQAERDADAELRREGAVPGDRHRLERRHRGDLGLGPEAEIELDRGENGGVGRGEPADVEVPVAQGELRVVLGEDLGDAALPAEHVARRDAVDPHEPLHAACAPPERCPVRLADVGHRCRAVKVVAVLVHDGMRVLVALLGRDRPSHCGRSSPPHRCRMSTELVPGDDVHPHR